MLGARPCAGDLERFYQTSAGRPILAAPRSSEKVRRVSLGVLELLRGEAAERPADIAFAQALERPIAELAHPLTGDAEHGTDLFERVLSAAFETEIEAKHLRIARRQGGECLLDLVGEEAVHRLFLGVRHLIG